MTSSDHLDGLESFIEIFFSGALYERIPNFHEIVPFFTLEQFLTFFGYVVVDVPDAQEVSGTRKDLTNGVDKGRLGIGA